MNTLFQEIFQVVEENDNFEIGFYFYDHGFEIYGPYKTRDEALAKMREVLSLTERK